MTNGSLRPDKHKDAGVKRHRKISTRTSVQVFRFADPQDVEGAMGLHGGGESLRCLVNACRGLGV